MPKCSIIQSGNDYAVKTPFSRAFVDLLKVAVPPAHRSFDRDSKAWIIEKTYADACLSNIIFECFGERLELPELKPVNQDTKYSFQLDYVGIPKERDGQAGKTALGFSKGQWRVVFSESILKEWFERVQVNTGEQTLFSLLGVYESATDQEIKSGYRRLARQWHPDVCKEENAEAMFKRISDAYQILSDPQKRARYQAGLAFERESNHEERRGYSIFNSSGEQVFIPPLRCGFLTVTGSVQVGRLRVSQILKWEDVTNEQGLTMVSSWSKEREAVVIEWV